jgi:ATP-dependent RNA helicase RhlE
MTSFAELGLIEPLLRALAADDYTTPTPIQAAAIPPALEGRDLLGIAQTGTGKTAAFTLPLLQRLAAKRGRTEPRAPRALILAPTRELALQIDEAIGRYGRELKLSRTTILGGVGQMPQVRALSRGVDILIATPGRLEDLIAQGHLRLNLVELLVLDEADRMLDMGFIHAVRRIAALVPKARQTLMFSATLPDAADQLAKTLLKDPVQVAVTPIASTVERVEQRVMLVARHDKRALLAELLADPAMARTLVFARTKHGADRIAEVLLRSGVKADAIHGNKAQNQRLRALHDFKSGRVRVLVATDIAARGIDVDGVSHVVNFDLPNEPESYVHRIGRTARNGADGTAIAFCDMDELPLLKAIEKTTGRRVAVDSGHRFHSPTIAEAWTALSRPRQQPARRDGPRSRPRGGFRGHQRGAEGRRAVG